jgi:hypothetical protein
MLANQTTAGPVVAKEIAYPSAGGPQASDVNQISWYHNYAAANTVAGEPFYFIYSEAYDQPWKSTIDAYEPHLGLNALDDPDGSSQPKPAVASLAADIVSAYSGTNVPPYASAQGLTLVEAPAAPFTANLGEFTDPNDPIGSSNDVYLASVLWGDGGGFEKANTSISGGTITVSASHTYAAPGQYTVQVALQRASGFGEVVQGEALVTQPAATTQAATAVTSTGATLNAAVNPAGSATAYEFLYGTNPTLATGATVSPAQPAGNGTVAVSGSVALAGLAPGTTYYFQVRATNANGTTDGAILSFTTASIPPAPVAITQLLIPKLKVGTGKHAKPEVIIALQFSGEVNGAAKLRAYLLQSGKTRKGVTRYTTIVRLASARYDASTQTVYLVPKTQLKLSVPDRLTVISSLVRDTFGRPLDGNHDGQPGGNFVARLSNKGVTIE